MKIAFDRRLKKFVDEHLYDDQSPKAISGRLKNHEKHLEYASKNSIHRYIKSVHGRKIEHRRNSRKQKRRKKKSGPSRLSDRNFINKRPNYIEKRARIGDAESDFIESGKTGKGILLVVVDRKFRASFLERITIITIPNVHRAFLKIKERFPELKTVTTDNDILLQKHQELEKLIAVRIFFCEPYKSWQKGTVENTNRVIRRDIPKGSNISSYSRSFIYNLEQKLNRRPMECLKYKKPSEMLEETRRRQQRQRRRHLV